MPIKHHPPASRPAPTDSETVSIEQLIEEIQACANDGVEPKIPSECIDDVLKALKTYLWLRDEGLIDDTP